MKDFRDKYLQYISTVRRYSPRTVAIYSDVLDRFHTFAGTSVPDSALTPSMVRNYEVYLLDEKGESPRTVNLHLSVLSGYCRYLLREGALRANPVKLVHRPKFRREVRLSL